MRDEMRLCIMYSTHITFDKKESLFYTLENMTDEEVRNMYFEAQAAAKESK